jgi:hypothetical protein
MGAAEGGSSSEGADGEARSREDWSKEGFPPAETGRAEEWEEPRDRLRGSIEVAKL